MLDVTISSCKTGQQRKPEGKKQLWSENTEESRGQKWGVSSKMFLLLTCTPPTSWTFPLGYETPVYLEQPHPLPFKQL